MRIKLVRPSLANVRAADAMQPLSFAILAALTPPDVEVSLVDERLMPLDESDTPDLAAITVETFTARRAYQIADALRARKVPVVVGGYHPTFLPDEAAEHADAVVIGDAEELWPQVVADARAGRLRPVYRQETAPNIAGVTPDRRIFRGHRYLPLNLVQFGRGCRYACDFCSIHAFYGAGYRRRPVAEVVGEIEKLDGRHVVFVDDNILSDTAASAELFAALIPLGIKWSCQISVDVCNSPELLPLMARSGCEVLMIGFESLEPENLAQMKKRWALNGGDYAAAIRKIQEHGIMVYGSFVLGYDHDTTASFDATVDFALASKMFLANFNPLMPMPGTTLYDRLKSAGRLLFDRWWLDPRFRYGDAMFRPKNMTPEQLTAGCFHARRRFNTYGSIFRRAFEFKTNCRSPRRLGTYMLGNWISRKEIHRKQGLALGGVADGATAIDSTARAAP